MEQIKPLQRTEFNIYSHPQACGVAGLSKMQETLLLNKPRRLDRSTYSHLLALRSLSDIAPSCKSKPLYIHAVVCAANIHRNSSLKFNAAIKFVIISPSLNFVIGINYVLNSVIFISPEHRMLKKIS